MIPVMTPTFRTFPDAEIRAVRMMEYQRAHAGFRIHQKPSVTARRSLPGFNSFQSAA